MANCTIKEKCSTTAEFIGYVYILTTVCALGVLFNITNLTIFVQKSFSEKISAATRIYITGLSIADGLYCFVLMPMGIMRCNEPSNPEENLFWTIYEVVIFLPSANTLVATSIWITLVISVERCIFIRLFSGVREVFLPKRAKLIVSSIFLAAVIFNLPYYFYYDFDKSLKYSSMDPIYTEFALTIYFEIFSWTRLALVKYIPITIVVIANGILIRATWVSLRKSSTMQTTLSMSRRAKAQTRMTGMLLSISTLFVVCNVLEPLLLPDVYTTIFGKCSQYDDQYNILLMIANIVESVSFASNFVCYCIFNRSFRMTLGKFLPCESNIIEVDTQPVATVKETFRT